MRTASCLTLIAIGAIFTFAVTAHPSFLNLQIAGVVIMATGVAGLLLRRNQPGWLRRRTILRRGPRGRVVGEVEETRLPPYVMLNLGASGQETAGSRPGDLTMGEAAAQTVPDLPAGDLSSEHAVVDDSPAAASEVVEEYVQE